MTRVAEGYKLGIIFFPTLPETELFREADPDTIEGQMWQIRLPIDRTTSKNGVSWMVSYVRPIVDQTAVAVMRTFIAKGVTAWSQWKTADLETLKGIKSLLSIDPTGRKYTNVMVFSRKMDPMAKKYLNIMVRRSTESGIHQYEMDHMYDSFTDGKGFMILTEKSSTSVETPEVDLPVTRLKNTKIFFAIMAAMILVSTMVLMLERIWRERDEIWNQFKLVLWPQFKLVLWTLIKSFYVPEQESGTKG